MVKNFQIKIQIYYANRHSWALLLLKVISVNRGSVKFLSPLLLSPLRTLKALNITCRVENV